MIEVRYSIKREGEVVMESITVGIDLAKQVFSVCIMDAQGRVTQRRELKRDGLAEWLAQLPAGAVVAMEACSSAHYWGRVCLDHGLQPRLMAATTTERITALRPGASPPPVQMAIRRMDEEGMQTPAQILDYPQVG